jgi:hypothetical protein
MLAVGWVRQRGGLSYGGAENGPRLHLAPVWRPPPRQAGASVECVDQRNSAGHHDLEAMRNWSMGPCLRPMFDGVRSREKLVDGREERR